MTGELNRSREWLEKLKTKNVMPKIYNNLGCYSCAKSISWKMIDLKRIKAILNYKINE